MHMKIALQSRAFSIAICFLFSTALRRELACADTPASASQDVEASTAGGVGKGGELPSNRFRPIEMFDLESASQPQISPDGAKVVFVRSYNDVMKDRKRSSLWI